MRRDFDLIREMLLAVEAHPHGRAQEIKVPGRSSAEIGYHAYLICDAGLAEGVDMTHMGSPGPEWILTSLTSEGHDFLDAARERSTWEQAKAIAAKAGGYTLRTIFEALITILAQRHLG
jgi:hypothetical protein